MSRRVLILDLKEDPALIAGYEAHHRPGAVPTAVLRSIAQAGIEAMELYRSGNRLVMVMETGPGFDPGAKAAADAENPAVVAWERLMDRYQQPVAWAPPGSKWVEAERIFSSADPAEDDPR